MKYFHAHHITHIEEDLFSSIAFYDDIDDPIDFVILSQATNNALILTLNETDDEFINVIEQVKLVQDTIIVQIKSNDAERVDYDYIEIECDDIQNVRSSLKKVCQNHCKVL